LQKQKIQKMVANIKKCCKVSKRNGKVVYKRCENVKGSCPLLEKKKNAKKLKLVNVPFIHVAISLITIEKVFGWKTKDHAEQENSVET